jgi:hypothetical protein
LQITEINQELLDTKLEIDHINELMKNCVDKLSNPLLSDEVKSLSQEEFIKLADKHLEGATNFESSFNKLYEIINNINVDSYQNIINIFEKYYDLLNEFILNSNTIVLSAVGHISASIFVLLCLLSIIAALFGDFIIKYLKLETNFPKIAKYIQLRRQFQTYYIVFNIILIVIVLLYVIFTDLYVLFYMFK